MTIQRQVREQNASDVLTPSDLFYQQPEAYLHQHEGMTLAILKIPRNKSGYLSHNEVTVLYTYGKGGKDRNGETTGLTPGPG